jgi:predicted nucleotidyltransferase
MKLSTNTLKTLAYFGVFNFPLTKQEVEKYSGETLNGPFEPLVVEHDGYFGLGDSASWVNRQKREEVSLRKIERAKELFRKIFWWPYLKAVLVTGSTAAMNAGEGSDVDVLIITSEDTLWLTRLVVVSFLILTRTYRRLICPNIWLAEDNLEWPDKNIHSACDAMLAKPILNKNETYERFLDANWWVQEFWPMGKQPELLASARAVNDLVKLLNRLLFDLEKIRRQLSGLENAGDDVLYNRLHFRQNNSSSKILARYEDLLASHQTFSRDEPKGGF